MRIPLPPSRTPFESSINALRNLDYLKRANQIRSISRAQEQDRERSAEQIRQKREILNRILPQQLQYDIESKKLQNQILHNKIMETPTRNKLLEGSVAQQGIQNQLAQESLKSQIFKRQNPLFGAPGPAGQYGAANVLREEAARKMGVPQSIPPTAIPNAMATGVAPPVAPPREEEEANQLIKNVQAQQEYKSALMKSRLSRSSGRMGAGLRAINAVKDQLKVEHPDWNESQLMDAQSAYLSGEDKLSSGEDLPQMSGTLSQMVSQALKYGTTSRTLVARRAAASLVPMLKSAQGMMPEISQYAGLFGKFRKGGAGALSLINSNPEAYSRYKYFTTQLVPTIVTDMIPTLMTTTTDDRVRTLARKINTIDEWYSNPKMAVQNFNRLVSLYQNEIIPNVAASGAEIEAKLRKVGSAPISDKSSDINDSNLAYTAKKYGISISEVRKRLGLENAG